MRNGPVTIFDKDGNLTHGSVDIPPQYLKGWVEWYKFKFKVTPDVLIPRPETELLVDEVITGFHPLRGETPLAVDVGTGSGCIAIAIAKNLPKSRIFALDISESALEIARENARRNRVDKRIFFIKSDLLKGVKPLERGFTPLIIVANLPYIPTSRISTLDPSVKDFEPQIALDGGPDGFDLYRRLFDQINHKFIQHTLGANVNHPPGGIGLDLLILCEIDQSHEKIALQEARKYFPTAQAKIKRDLAKKPRVLRISFS